MAWEEIVARKREQRAADVASAKGHSGLAADSIDLEKFSNGFDISSLTAAYQRRDVSVELIVQTCIQQAVAAHEKTNCLTETLFESAVQRAKKLDEHFRTHGTLVGPFHGVPMSVKDQFDIEGADSTIGYVGRAFKPATEHSTLVKLLLRLGAVIIAKTNVPQTILWVETENPLWGRTSHPLKQEFTCGGSSGGEAALITLGGSLCGWGTDIGGSIRQPSHFTGLFGLKPSSNRMSHQGATGPHEGQNHVPSSVGPMARNLSSLVTMTKTILDAEGDLEDHHVVPLPWREHLYREIQERPLRIGLIISDGVVNPHPPVWRAVREAADLLAQKGHEVIPWDTSDHWNWIQVQDRLYRADGGEDLTRAIEASGEPYMPHTQALIAKDKEVSVYEYWQLIRARALAQKQHLQRWKEAGVDVLISPVAANSALPYGKHKWTGYTKVWNFLDYTALSFPWTHVSKELDGPASVYKSGQQKLPEHSVQLNAYTESLYDVSDMAGMPVGIQIIGKRFDEERVLGVANLLETYRKEMHAHA